ncbi:MAG: GDP-6-deoxy-D-mannose reductase [Chlamydiales bacterium]|nr:GDP-6-deoxy-D-mannose reductase [Chlamydiales bacterium]MCH9635412.1 GDP-6-deoxy-D-mannose reductase [Chlamydiales bacterium]
MKILVTGGSGFIGRALLPLLQEHEVHLIEKYEFQTDLAKVHLCDLFEKTQLMRLMHEIGADCLIHLAWDTTPGQYQNSLGNMEWHAASCRLFDYFVRAGGKRIVAAGSCAEYGDAEGICHETKTALKPTSMYGASKASLFLMGEQFAKQKGISFAWGRIFFPYGPWEKGERLIPQLLDSGSETFEIHNYNQSKDFIYVEDVARAFAALVTSNHCGPINIGSGRAIKLGDLGNMITKVPPRASTESIQIADIGLLEKIAKPKVSLEEGIAKTKEWREDAAYYRYR